MNFRRFGGASPCGSKSRSQTGTKEFLLAGFRLSFPTHCGRFEEKTHWRPPLQMIFKRAFEGGTCAPSVSTHRIRGPGTCRTVIVYETRSDSILPETFLYWGV